MPASPPANLSMPVVIWGNGQCYGDGLAYGGFLSQVASYGIVVISNGWFKQSSSRNQYQVDITKNLSYYTNAITWIQKQAGAAGTKYERVNGTALGAAGHSCGGYQTIGMRSDARVKMLAPFGYFTEQAGWASEIKVPVGAFVGANDPGPALSQLRSGWSRLPSSTPGWWGTYPGYNHDNAFDIANGGVWADSFAKWILFSLAGDRTAATYFTGSGATNDRWTVQKQSLDKIPLKN